nr:LOW QUALITY PROTEIN: RCC1 and BTB domain-containing protein 2-like [Dermatophagoides farinae]
MARSPNESIDIELFQDDFKNIDQEFLQSVVSIFKFGISTENSFMEEFLLMTKEATFAYGEQICSWLSLEHDMSKPQRISLLNDVKIVQVDFGWGFVAILTDDGKVFIASKVKSNWKTNKTLRLINTGNDKFKMIACGRWHLLLLRQDGHVFSMGNNSHGQIAGNERLSYDSMIQIKKLENVKLIACGFDHNLSITNKEETYSWGGNSFGQLGLGDEKDRKTPRLVAFPNVDSTRIKDIVAGIFFSLFLFENGQLWACGSNYNGVLGLGETKIRSTPTKIPIKNVKQIVCSKVDSFLLANDGSSYYAWGKAKYRKWSSPKRFDDHPTSFVAASTMIFPSPLTFGLTSTIYVFGSHDSISYQSKSILQLFDNQDSYDVEFLIDQKPIKACKCYLESISEYYRRMFSGNWSENDQVNINNYSYDTYYAYLLMLHTGKIHINHQNIIELVDLANCYGDLKLMEHCETFIRNDLNAQTMTTYLPLIIKYELKILEYKFRNIAKPLAEKIDIDLFEEDLEDIHQEFLQSVVSIFSFSFNVEKQFLLMTKEATYAYGVEICTWLSLEHKWSEPQRISLLDDMKIVQVDYGRNFIAILTDNGQVFLASDEETKWKTNKTLRLINTGTDRFKMISCGKLHLLLLRQDGHVFAMGDNSHGQITGNKKSSYESMIDIDNLENTELIACGWFHSLSITNNGEIYSWGHNDFGQLGLGDENKRNAPCLVSYPIADSTLIKDIVAGDRHSLFLFENGQLWGCGSNSDGELGLGDDIKQLVLTKIPIENVQQIVCSKFHSFSLAYDGSSYYAWGKIIYSKLLSPRELDDSHSSFASASVQVLNPFTFCLTSIIHEFKLHDPISYQCKSIQLFNNQDSYDMEFIIDGKRIKVCKCYLKSVSKFYGDKFSDDWKEKKEVTINEYSYDAYYEYLRMLHTGKIYINRQNITELVGMANCYGVERLMKYCETFIQNDLNKQTMLTYVPLINKYQEFYAKLVHLDQN